MKNLFEFINVEVDQGENQDHPSHDWEPDDDEVFRLIFFL